MAVPGVRLRRLDVILGEIIRTRPDVGHDDLEAVAQVVGWLSRADDSKWLIDAADSDGAA